MAIRKPELKSENNLTTMIISDIRGNPILCVDHTYTHTAWSVPEYLWRGSGGKSCCLEQRAVGEKIGSHEKSHNLLEEWTRRLNLDHQPRTTV